MHPQQKAAWFTLIVIGTAVVLYVGAVPSLSWWFHRSWTAVAGPALGVFGLVGLLGFSRLFYRRPPGAGVVTDERDQQLAQQAWRAGMATFWLFFTLVSMGAWFWLYHGLGLRQVTVPVAIFPVMVYAGFIIYSVASAVATLHFYGWRTPDGR